jgi:hypothetical protein
VEGLCLEQCRAPAVLTLHPAVLAVAWALSLSPPTPSTRSCR